MTWINDASLQAQRASQWATITTISLVFTAMMVLVGALRIWVRRHKLQADDWITLVTMVCFNLLEDNPIHESFPHACFPDLELSLQLLHDIA